MEKEMQVKKPVDYISNRTKLVIISSLLFFSVAVITLAIILYSAYFFTVTFLKVSFRIIIAIIGILTYYILITEFIKFYIRR